MNIDFRLWYPPSLANRTSIQFAKGNKAKPVEATIRRSKIQIQGTRHANEALT
jgi:hypothetical protein